MLVLYNDHEQTEALMEKIVTVEQIAERLQVNNQTVRKWLREGELAGMPFGGRTGWRVNEADLQTFLDRRHRVGAGADAKQNVSSVASGDRSQAPPAPSAGEENFSVTITESKVHERPVPRETPRRRRKHRVYDERPSPSADPSKIALTAPDLREIDARGTSWNDIIPRHVRLDRAIDDYIPRHELMERLEAEGISVSQHDLQNWQYDGIIPYGINRSDGRGLRTFFHPAMPHIIRMVRALQADGLTLDEIRPKLIEHFGRLLRVPGSSENSISPTWRAPALDFGPRVAQMAREYEAHFAKGDPLTNIAYAEVRLIDEEGRPMVFRYDVRTPDNPNH
jgi:excisionase family DNA binding protein